MKSPENVNSLIEEDDISLKDLVRNLKKWWKYILSKAFIILIAAFIGGALGFINSYFVKPVFTAELTFVLEGGGQGTSSIGSYAGLASQFGFDMGGGGQGVFEGENFLALMKSRLMIEKALLTAVNLNGRQTTLIEFYLDTYNLRTAWAKKKSPLAKVKFPPGSEPNSFSIYQNMIVGIAHRDITSNNLSVDKKDKKSGIISLRVNSESELFSKFFAEILALEVSKFYVETKTKQSSENVRILQHQTDSIKRALGRSMAGVATSMDANPNPNMARQILRVPSQQRQGDVQINQVILAQLVQNLEIAKMSLRTETPLIQIIDRPVLPLVKSAPDALMSFFKWAILTSICVIIYLIISRVFKDL